MQDGEPGPLRMEYEGSWLLEPNERTDFYLMLRSLPLLFEEDSVLALEDVLAPEIMELFEQNVPSKKAALETLGGGWRLDLSLVPPFVRKKHSDVLHMQMTKENLARLVEMADHHAGPEVCMHLAVYREEEVLMEYHDASTGGLPFVSGGVHESKVKAFSEALGFSYARYTMQE